MGNREWQRRPTAEHRFWLYDPEGDGMMYFDSAEKRDEEAREAMTGYDDSNDGWSEDVEFLAVGEVTATVQAVDRKERPCNLDENLEDEEGNYWGDFAWMGTYKLIELEPR